MSKVYPTPNQVKRLALAIDEDEMEKIQTKLKDYTGDGCIVLLDFKPSPSSIKELEKSGWEVFQETKVRKSTYSWFKDMACWGIIVCYPTICITLGVAGVIIQHSIMAWGGWLSLILYPFLITFLMDVARN